MAIDWLCSTTCFRVPGLASNLVVEALAEADDLLGDGGFVVEEVMGLLGGALAGPVALGCTGG